MSLAHLLDKVSNQKLQPFIAPVPVGSIDILNIQSGVPYWFTFINEDPGWKTLEPISKDRLGRWSVRATGEPEPYQAEEYLDQLPHFHVIALYPVSEGGWLCIPHSLGDVKQRGWNGEPKVVTLCQGSIEPLDVLRVANLAGTLLYHDFSKLTLESHVVVEKFKKNEIPRSASYFTAVQLIRERIEKIKKAQKKTDLDSQIKDALDFVGADLVGYRENWDGSLQVTYQYDGMEWTLPEVNKDLKIQVAGICLSGTDNTYSLSSIVQVMQEARVKRRFDLPREYYL